MTKSSKVTLPPEKTIAGFEHEIMAHTPQQGIMDAVSLGIWGIAEQSGQLAGEWKRHRNLGQDLDIAKVSTALGELLAAITQTARAVGVSLEAVMDQQVARALTPEMLSARARKTVPVPPPPRVSSPLASPPANIRALTPSAPPSTKELPTPAKRRQGRPPLVPAVVEQPTLMSPVRQPEPFALPVDRPKRGRPRLTQEPAAALVPNATPVAKRQRPSPTPPVVPAPVVQVELEPVTPPAKQLATATRKRSRAGVS